MRMLVLKRGEFSGTTASLLEAWRTASPQDRIEVCDLDEGFFESRVDKLRALPQLIKAGATQGLAESARNFRQIASRSSSNLSRLERDVSGALESHEFDCVLMVGTSIPIRSAVKPAFIYTDHAILTNRYYPDGEPAIKRWEAWLPAERRTIAACSRIFTMSQHVSDSLVEFYACSREQVVCVGAGPNAKETQHPTRNGPRNKNIVFVGLDWERKGGPQMVEAFAKVHLKHPDATLTIVGCEPKVAQPGVRILGVVPLEQIGEIMSGGCCFCMPGLREPFGIVYLEAMRAGLPVIALDMGAPRDFVVNDETGYLVPPFDIAALSAAMEKLVANSENCARMGEQARKRVSEEYTWATTQSRMAHAIEGVLAETAG